ncbi:MAG TPA: hypothetical protein VG735_06980 [Caulobacterales bacterium]|jgi:hypothetical protein|nr:hypothetical protein [Caulobacterales bacterium]
MSFDYYVAVRRDKWPTAQEVQDALERLSYPVSLESPSAEPFSVSVNLSVVFEGRPVALEANVEKATEIDDGDTLWGYIAQCSASNFLISNGDYFLTLTFRSDADQIRAGLYLAAAMILSFDGYGFENQFESHGGTEFAQQLATEAADVAAFETP